MVFIVFFGLNLVGRCVSKWKIREYHLEYHNTMNTMNTIFFTAYFFRFTLFFAFILFLHSTFHPLLPFLISLTFAPPAHAN